jgi:DNA modification methylase
MGNIEVHHGDCIEVMRTMHAESVDAIVTSPPYAEQRKSTYGGIPEKDYPAWTVAWMTEAWRVLKPNGSVIINISPHINKGQLSDYVLRTRLAVRESGWIEVDELIWHKTNAMPSGSPRKPKRAWESLLWYGKHGQPWSDAKANGRPAVHRTGHWSSKKAERLGWDHGGASGRSVPEIARSLNLVAMGNSSKAGVDHPAPFPWQLAEWCGKLICPPGGTILDPFSGSASTGVAAIRNGWDYIGIDAVEEYVDMSRTRLAGEAA